MKIRAKGLLLTAALLSFACRGERSTTTQTSTDAAPAAPVSTSSAPASAPATSQYDLQFLDAMNRHHQSAVEMADMATRRAASPEIQKMAATMSAAQQKEIAQLKAWRDHWFPNAPAADISSIPGAASMNMDMSHMQSMQGHEFDMMFVEMMIPHHEGAITMSCDAHAKAQHEEIKRFARDVIRAQEEEISRLQQWKSGM